jgi:hypothetical protein
MTAAEDFIEEDQLVEPRFERIGGTEKEIPLIIIPGCSIDFSKV